MKSDKAMKQQKKLYEKLGYSPIGTRKRFYERPVEDAIVMSKIL